MQKKNGDLLTVYWMSESRIPAAVYDLAVLGRLLLNIQALDTHTRTHTHHLSPPPPPPRTSDCGS